MKSVVKKVITRATPDISLVNKFYERKYELSRCVYAECQFAVLILPTNRFLSPSSDESFCQKLFLIFYLNSSEVFSDSAIAMPAVLIVEQIVFNDKSFGLVQMEEFKTKPLVEILGCKSWRMEKTGYLLL